MTTYYFAARYSRALELREYRDQLEAAIDAAVTSRWIDHHDGELEASYTPDYLNTHPDECWRHGQRDFEDLEDSDVLVSFTGTGGKGGRHIEHGYWLACIPNDLDIGAPWRRVVIVGARENIFHCHPRTEVYPDFAAFLAHEQAHAMAKAAQQFGYAPIPKAD